MTASEPTTIRVALPTDFHPLPQEDEDAERMIAAIVESCGVGDRRKSRLEAELKGAVDYVRARSAGRGRGWALVKDPATGVVDAVVMAEAHRRPEGYGPREHIELCQEAVRNLVAEDLWKFDASVTTISGSEAAVLHQIEVPSGEQSKRAIEQVAVVLFVDESEYLEYRLVTQDLGLDEDIVGFTTALAAFSTRTGTDS